MTETDWLDCTDARRMLDYQYRQAIAAKPPLLVGLRLRFWRKARPQGIVSDRKLRLFACVCSRLAWDDLDGDTCRVIELAEEAADQRVSRAELRRAAVRSRSPISVWLAAGTIHEQPSWLFLNWLATGSTGKQREQMALLRHILGNPFRLYSVSDPWPLAVVQLAKALYHGQDCGFALHDALLEAGHSKLAEHFRQEDRHPKGCWALDLFLGKS
jgi:hypothetical protein